MSYDTESNPVTLTLYSSPAGRYHNPRPERPSNLRTLRTFGAQPCQSSRRRCVQWRSRIGGGERSEPIRRMLIIPYDIESQSRNADFILIARKGDTTTLGPKGNPQPSGPKAPSNLRTLRTFGAQPRQPSRRRRVQRRSLHSSGSSLPSSVFCTMRICLSTVSSFQRVSSSSSPARRRTHFPLSPV